MKRDEEFIIKKNEADANEKVAKVMIVTFLLFTVILILNLIGVFIIPQKVMITAYLVSAILLWLPTIMNRVFSPSAHWLKYCYIVFSNLFLFIIIVLLSYHALVIYALPIAIAGIYFSTRETRLAIFLTMFFTIAGQIAGYYLDFLNDANFHNLFELMLFGVAPRIMTLAAFSSLLMLLTNRTSKLLKEQVEDTTKILDLHKDMITGFANLVENRDESTGGHIRRTSKYVELLSKELKIRGIYRDIIDEDFIKNIIQAAPMHDIGKIAVPDQILQKPGKLDDDEFALMKTHAEKGGKIIEENFSHVGDETYRTMAFQVARYHHEKWNGRGYPDGLSSYSIPLPARIMAIADVFDAVSAKRCYREALPEDVCFQIIEKGKGEDFEPELVDVFLAVRDQVLEIKNNG